MDYVETYLDGILKASGSGLKNYSMQKTLDDMKNAVMSVWVSVLDSEIPTDRKVDVMTNGLYAGQERLTDCSHDHICDEWRKIDESLRIVRIPRRFITHWMPVPNKPQPVSVHR